MRADNFIRREKFSFQFLKSFNEIYRARLARRSENNFEAVN